MTSKQAAKAAGVSVGTLIKRAKAVGALPKRTIQTGKRGRPGLDWTEAQAKRAMGA